MKKTKAGFICIFLIIISFFLNSYLYADKFSLKLTVGTNSGGVLTESFMFNPEYYDHTAVFPPEKQKMGVDVYFEFLYALNPYISFSIGTGYASKSLNGVSPRFDPNEGSPFNIIYGFKPNINAEIVPFCFSTQLSLPLIQHFQVNFKAGVGYYYGNFESRAELEFVIPARDFTTRPINYSGSGSHIGYHLGGSLDIPTPIAGIDLTVEVLHTWIKYKEITGESIGGEGTTLAYYWKMPGGQFYLAYNVLAIDFSGFTFRAGLKIRF